MSPTLVWFRRDLRLRDHEALSAAVARGGPIIPVFIYDEAVSDLGAAPAWRMAAAVVHFKDMLKSIGSDLILRRGPAQKVLQDLVSETGAGAVYWSRSYDPQYQSRDATIKSTLKEAGITAQSFTGHLLFEPWSVQTKTGGFYKVFTPMWKAVRGADISGILPICSHLPAPDVWPASDNLLDWELGHAMRRGADVVAKHAVVGEERALNRLNEFLQNRVGQYATDRDLPGVDGTSGLSENLTHGEISPRQCWHAGMAALHKGKADAEVFVKELVWREFAYHLLHHTPHITTQNWRPEWDAFPWNTNVDHPHVQAWMQGRTGIPFVDAGMRQMYVTGIMHNRARMIVASYLTKHLLSHWRIGQEWFADCLLDWDPASNAMGWQWAAGSGPDAAPYFRVFNPVTQLEKFDKSGVYARNWIAEATPNPTQTALSYFDAIPRAWGLAPTDAYPGPIVSAAEGRVKALDAYQNRRF